MKLGEFDFIAKLRNAFPPKSGAFLGIGDDCAVLPFDRLTASRRSGELLVSTDLLTEGVHFLLDDITPRQLGWKSLAVNISDIAAMGGTPKAFFLSIAIPASVPHLASAPADEGGGVSEAGGPDDDVSLSGTGRCDEAWFDAFIYGLKSIADRFGVELLGGDTSRSVGPLTINVTILGTCAKGKSVKRSAARPGDLICVSGCLGDSAAGLRLIQERRSGLQGNAIAEELIRRHYEPQPRVALGQALAAMPGIGAMMDLSDGLAADLPHILEASSLSQGSGTPAALHKTDASGFGSTPPASLGARIDPSRIPLSEELQAICREKGWDALQLAIEGGEDYELLFTCRPDAPLDAMRGGGTLSSLHLSPGLSLARDLITIIGRITDTPGIVWEGLHRTFQGFRHF